MSVTVLLMDMTSYDSYFLVRGTFLFEQMLDRCACMWPLNVASEIGEYFVTWFTVNSVQD